MMKCILLHGLGQRPSAWNSTMEHMDRELEVHCPDLFEWMPEGDADYRHVYRGLEDYCSRFHEPFILGGLSLGGILALQYAIEHGESVHALLLMGTQFSMPRRLLKLQNIMFHFLPNAAFAEMGMSKSDGIALCHSMMNLEFSAQLSEIRCRTLVVCGQKDRSNISASIQLHERLAHAELAIIPQAGHEVNADKPADLGRIISAFCRA